MSATVRKNMIEGYLVSFPNIKKYNSNSIYFRWLVHFYEYTMNNI